MNNIMTRLQRNRKASYRILRVTLLALVLLVPFVIKANCMENNSANTTTDTIEMYSDEMPKSKLVFTMQIPKEQMWKKDASLEDKKNNIVKIFWDFFNSNNLESIGTSLGNKEDRFGWILTNVTENQLKDAVTVWIRYKDNSLTSSFEKTESYIHSLFYAMNNVPKPSSSISSKLFLKTHFEMSWDFISTKMIHGEMLIPLKMRKELSSNDIFLKNAIDHRGLEEVMKRIAVTVNKNGDCSFYTLYNKDSERDSGELFLKELKYLIPDHHNIPHSSLLQ